jgi:hypothetical protein
MINIASSHLNNEILPFQPEQPPLAQPVEVRIFNQINANGRAQKAASSLHPLLANPGEIIVGGMWSFCLVLYATISVDSLYKLYHACTVEHLPSEQFEKIGSAVKEAFVNLIGLAGTGAYTVYWAYEAKLISLGQYAPLFKGFGIGGSLIIGSIESGAAGYNIYKEKEAILAERSPAEREKHKQRLCLALMKLIGNVSMVAWAALGITTIAFGIAFSPILTTTILGIACLFSTAAYFYQWRLDNWPEWCPYPTFIASK